jgi:hypothetical protein
MLPAVMRLEMRRPATWLGVVSGAVAAGIDVPWLAVAAGAVASVGAAGDLPVVRSVRVRILRGLLPLLGVCAAALVRDAMPAAGVLGGAIAATAATVGCLTARGASAADAASVALVAAGTGIAAMRGGAAVGISAGPALAAGWTAAAVVAAWYQRWAESRVVAVVRAAGLSLGRGPLPAAGPLRRMLGWVAMGSTLAAMAGWLLLTPEQAPAAGDLAVGWFVALALPAALLQDGDALRMAWDGLMRSAARGRAGRQAAPLGPLRQACDTIFGHAAVFGWPAVVAMALGAAAPHGIWPAARVVAGVAAAAAALGLLAAICFSSRWSGESAMAAAAVAVAVMAWAATRHTGGSVHRSEGPVEAPFLHVAPESRC